MDEMFISALENKDDICRFFTDNFRMIRRRLGMRQEEIAKALGTTQRRISEIETGKAKVSWTLMLALSIVWAIRVKTKDEDVETQKTLDQWKEGDWLMFLSAAIK